MVVCTCPCMEEGGRGGRDGTLQALLATEGSMLDVST